MSDYILEMNHIAKIYGNGVVANSDVSFNLKEGEIHALVGENGAGKSTLMKVLFGMEQPSRGEILLRGNKLRLNGSRDAIARGIGMVHQHFMLVESFTVAQNIMLGMEMKKGIIVDRRKAAEFTRQIGEKYNLPVDPDARVSSLPVGVKQKVEILKALARGAKILILDEPTAVLTPQETAQLFENLRHLKKQGHTVVFISHKIPEIQEISDRLTIMRKGKTVGTYETKDLTEKEISSMIMGMTLDTTIRKQKGTFGDIGLKVENVSYETSSGVNLVDDISFSVRKGMIFGLAGVQGNGQVELVRMMTKTLPIRKGTVSFLGKELANTDYAIIRYGKFGYIPEDRLEQGVAGAESIQDNMISNRVDTEEFSHRGVLKKDAIHTFAEKNIRQYEIRCNGDATPVSMLSGGNIQKVVVARECGHDPEVLIAEQPTRGVDVGAAYIIHQQLVKLRDAGCAILLITADLNELLKLSDVVGVMYEGKLVAYFDETEGLNEEKLGLYMLGIERHSEEQIRKARNLT